MTFQEAYQQQCQQDAWQGYLQTEDRLTRLRRVADNARRAVEEEEQRLQREQNTLLQQRTE